MSYEGFEPLNIALRIRLKPLVPPDDVPGQDTARQHIDDKRLQVPHSQIFLQKHINSVFFYKFKINNPIII